MSGLSNAKLPAGWIQASLREVLLRIEAGKSFACEPRPAEPGEWGIIKVSAMTWGKFDEAENKALPAERVPNPAYEIHTGDILVSRANTQAYVGAPVLVGQCRPHLLLSDKSLRLVPDGSVDKKWLTYILSSPEARKYISNRATGTKDSMRNISQQALLDMPLGIPPLAEQHRIVEALDDHLSHLDAAVRELKGTLRKISTFRKSTLLRLVPEVPPSTWYLTTIGEAGTIELGRQRHPDWHHGPEMRPYLRVANVFEDRIDTSDVMEMDFSGVFEKYRLKPGDVLLNEGQSPHLVGRPAIYRGTPPNVAYTNSILRFRCRHDVLPEWALMVFRRHMHARRFMREVRITTNIAHLSAKRLKSVEFPIPSLEEQKRLIQACDETMSNSDALERAVESNLARAKHLRNSLLNHAFSGKLVPQDVADEPASVLLHSIRAEREDQCRKGRGAPRRSRNSAAAVGGPPLPFATMTPALTNAVQQELSL